MRAKIILTFVVVLAVIFGGAYFVIKGAPSFVGMEKESSLYAVHLNNGQVYFGEIARITRDRIVLAEAYSIEKYESAGNTLAESKSFAIAQPPQQIYRLMKHGDEKSLATDHTLHINRSAVLFWEKLSADSDVVSSIKATK